MKISVPLFLMQNALLSSSFTTSPDFFSRALLSHLSSQHSQTYYALTVYFFLAFALCGLLAGLAYLFSISTSQETEKRSEYECGFAPFDSATRLPFDVHFYLVGILFLIFDVEVALLFPWVLSLRTTGWFGFYLMLAFLLILTLGFLYEWKRGALIWPTRYSKKSLSPVFALTLSTENDLVQGLIAVLSTWPGFILASVFTLHRLALLYSWAQRSKRIPQQKARRVFWFICTAIFFSSLYHSYYLSLALAIVFFVSSYLEENPFWPARGYWWSRAYLIALPIIHRPRPYRALLKFWAPIFLTLLALALYVAYLMYGPLFAHKLIYMGTLLTKIAAFKNNVVFLFGAVFLPGLETASSIIFVPVMLGLGHLLEYCATLIGWPNMFALLLIFWMVASVLCYYVYGLLSFTLMGALYHKGAKDPSILVTMHYLWTELRLTAVFLAVATVLCLTDWNLISVAANAALITAQLDGIEALENLIALTLAAPGEILAFLQRSLEAIVKYTVALFGSLFLAIKATPALLLLIWRFKYGFLWLLFCIRGYFYTAYMHRMETRTWYGKLIYTISILIYTYLTPVINLFHFFAPLYRHLLATINTYYAKDNSASTEEKPVQLTANPKVETTGPRDLSVGVAVAIHDTTRPPIDLDCQDDIFSSLASKECMDQIAWVEIFNEDLTQVQNILTITLVLLAARFLLLMLRWFCLDSIPETASAAVVKKYAWSQKKVLPQQEVTKKAAAALYDEPATNWSWSEFNQDLLEMLVATKQETTLIYLDTITLVVWCVNFFIWNCLLSRKCQHHEAQLQGILTDGALVVSTQEVKKPSSPAVKSVMLLAHADVLEVLSPTRLELTSGQLSGFPLLAEAVLFLLICAVITKLSFDLGKEHNKRVLAFTSWKILSRGLFAVLFIYLYQFIFDAGSATVLGGYFATSRTITLLKLLTLVSAVFVLDASETFMRQHSRHLLEYPIMVALTTFFMLLLVSANHVMSTFLALVGFSLGLYVLILYDANRRPSREAGLKYYYLSTLSSGFILYGILLIYTLTGTGNFDELFLLFNVKVQFQENALLRTALLLVLAGFFFKLSAFPGHLWAADVYEGSPSPVTAFFMLPVKIVVLGAFIRLFSVALAPLAAYWLPLLTLAVIISIVWGALASVQEKKVRRFLAYASINQMGFLLMGLTTDSDEGYQAALLYIIVYAVMTCAFLTIFLSARRQDGSELLYVSDFRTLANRNWLVGWSLAIVLFSMAGIPPLGGFFAKYLVLLHAFEKNLIAEVVVGLATSLISTYYYLRIIKIVKFEQPDGAMPSSPCLTARRQSQLFIAEALLWSFIVFAPAVLGLTYTLALTQGPACLLF